MQQKLTEGQVLPTEWWYTYIYTHKTVTYTYFCNWLADIMLNVDG